MVIMCFPSPQLELTLSELLSAEWRALHPGSRIVSRANGKGASKVRPLLLTLYRTAGNIGSQLNLAVWRFGGWGSDCQI